MQTICATTSSGLGIARQHAALGQPVQHWGRIRPITVFGSERSGLWCCYAAKTDTQRVAQDRIATQKIENVTDTYCDDFECTSSPAVEQFLRSFARDTTRLRYAQGLFQPDVQYSDGFRTFKGNTKYANQRWLADNIQKPTVTINNMKMLDKATAQIDWRVAGDMSGAQVDIPITSVITMNLLTGRIVNHKETWDLSRVPQPAATLASINRLLWSLRASSADASEGVSKKVNDVLSSMDEDSQSNQIYKDPTDPTKFFQNDNSQWNDYVSYAFLAALLYLAAKAFTELNKLP